MTVTQYNSSVRQMSQSKFNSMKDSNGKIPDLANQIVMTDSEDVNNYCLRTEVIYDMTSSDANINWGYASGIKGNEYINGKDFSKYTRLIIHIIFANCITTTGVVDLEKITQDSNSSSGYNYKNRIITGSETSSSDIYFCYVKISSNKTVIANDGMGYYAGTTVNARNNNANYYIYKIEGVLKTPSMIYTGDELIAGNGITINNGTIGITPAQSVALNTTRTGQNDTVVEYYMSSDGKTWYRKWASGWKEIGGHIDLNRNIPKQDTYGVDINISAVGFTETPKIFCAIGSGDGYSSYLLYTKNYNETLTNKDTVRLTGRNLSTDGLLVNAKIDYYFAGY